MTKIPPDIQWMFDSITPGTAAYRQSSINYSLDMARAARKISQISKNKEEKDLRLKCFLNPSDLDAKNTLFKMLANQRYEKRYDAAKERFLNLGHNWQTASALAETEANKERNDFYRIYRTVDPLRDYLY